MTDVFVKRPGAILDYQKDWTDWLGTDTIATSIWTVPTGITQVSESETTTKATIWVSGGTDGQDYLIVNTITTAGGRTEQAHIIIQVRSAPGTILTRAEGATVLRCDLDDANLVDLLPLVDGYIQQATGHDWAADAVIREEAKSAARMLLVRWHEDPGGMAAGASLGFGLTACLTQLEALALRYVTFEGLSAAGYIAVSDVLEGSTVGSVTGVVGVTGDQSAKFETVISTDGYIQQISGSDLSDKWFSAYLVPAGAV